METIYELLMKELKGLQEMILEFEGQLELADFEERYRKEQVLVFLYDRIFVVKQRLKEVRKWDQKDKNPKKYLSSRKVTSKKLNIQQAFVNQNDISPKKGREVSAVERVRKEKKMTKQTICKMALVSSGYVSKLEYGTSYRWGHERFRVYEVLELTDAEILENEAFLERKIQDKSSFNLLLFRYGITNEELRRKTNIIFVREKSLSLEMAQKIAGAFDLEISELELYINTKQIPEHFFWGKRLRLYKGIRHMDVMQQLGINSSELVAYENGVRVLPGNKELEYAKLLNVSYVELKMAWDDQFGKNKREATEQRRKIKFIGVYMRRITGLHQWQVAKLIGCSRHTVYHFETGKSLMCESMLQKYCEIIKAPYDIIVSEWKQMFRPEQTNKPTEVTNHERIN